MASQSLKSRVLSPRPILKAPLSSMRLSLKRPAPLNEDDLEPLLSASLKVEFSPGLLSPHVHFPPSPQIKSTIPSKSPSPKDKRDGPSFVLTTTKAPADVPTTFGYDTSSTSSSSDADSDDSSTETNLEPSVRFIAVPNSPIPRARSQQDIDKALSFLPYPLSPYPRSPKDQNRRVNRPSFVKSSKRSTVANTANGKPRLSALVVPKTARFVPPGLLSHTTLSPVIESPTVTVNCPSSDEATDSTTATLRTAFWRSVSVEERPESDSDGANSTDSRDSLPTSIGVLSPGVPSTENLVPPSSPYPIFMFGRRAKGKLSPPGLTHEERASTEGIMSPPPYSATTIASAAKNFEMMTSPAPNDNMLSFSSLGAALEYLGANDMIDCDCGLGGGK